MTSRSSLTCPYFDSSRCRSCRLLAEVQPTSANAPLPRLAEEIQALAKSTNPWQRVQHPFGSRAKAKMSVSGSCDAPIIGILDAKLQGVELLRCSLHKPILNRALALLPELLSAQQVLPYKIASREGELKGLILQTNNAETEIRIRFVLRSEQALPEIEKIGVGLQSRFDSPLQVSANIQPIPHQILEGDLEHHLLGEELLWEHYDETAVAFPAQSFMQVTPEVAAKLYSAVRKIVSQSTGKRVLDLFCGAGGFALHCAPLAAKTLGIELAATAVAAARHSVERNKLSNIEFIAASVETALQQAIEFDPEIVICNPPRRGLGATLLGGINEIQPETLLYSSCNQETFIADCAHLLKDYVLEEVTPFEMFPLTEHFELLGRFTRR